MSSSDEVRDPAIYPGTFATCVFYPDKALCHQDRDSRGNLHPTLGTCRPLDCGNVALTPDNLAQLRTELAQVNDALTVRPSLPPLLQLSQRRNRTPPARTTAVPGRPRRDEPIRPTHTKTDELRRNNHELTEHLEFALANIQRLSLENHQLRQHLEAVSNVARIGRQDARQALVAIEDSRPGVVRADAVGDAEGGHERDLYLILLDEVAGGC